MNIETWYDIGCDICGRHRSTDFERGLATTKKGLSEKAKIEGWRFIDNKNICPVCAKERERVRERGVER